MSTTTQETARDPNAPTAEQLRHRRLRREAPRGAVTRHTVCGRALRQAERLAGTLEELGRLCERALQRGGPRDPMWHMEIEAASEAAYYPGWQVRLIVTTLDAAYAEWLDSYRCKAEGLL